MNATGFSVGTELRKTVGRPEWDRLITDARTEFPGWLTLRPTGTIMQRSPGGRAWTSSGSRPTSSWAHHANPIRLQGRSPGKPVIFNEIGYKSHSGATAHPWEWKVTGEVDYLIQQAAYEAAFRSLWGEPWFAGFYWWKWRPRSGPFENLECNFTPQGKPAADVIREWYGANDERGS